MRKLHVSTLWSMKTYFVGASVVALIAGCATAASAACTTGNPVDCTGTTVGKVTLSSTGTVDVANGATLSAGAGDNAALGATSGAGAGTTATFQVDGTLSGNYAGIIGNATAPNYAYPSTRLDITVGATGQVYGLAAIYLDGTSGGSGYRTVGATLDNSGLIRGSSLALSVTSPVAGFFSVTNETSGIIKGNFGAISAVVGNLTNAGLIDGGSGSAYTYYSGVGLFTNPSTVANSGVVTSSSMWGTIDLTAGSPTITNSGIISDTGTGDAILANAYLSITNTAAGVITGRTSGFAVQAFGGGALVNQGRINGGVFLGGSLGSNSVLTNIGGTINGNIQFGSGDDTLNVAWDAAANRIAGISGTIDGGGGTNTLRIDFAQDVTLDDVFGRLVMPTNFQKLGIVTDTGVTATLNGDAPDGLLIGGNGDLVTAGQVTSAGASFTQTLGPPYDYTTAIGFTNSGNIRSVFSPVGGVIQYNDYGVQLSAVRSFANSGTITAVAGNGVSVVLGSMNGGTSGTFLNSGTIAADGTALNLLSGGQTVTNSGIVRSTGGIGLSFSGGSGTLDNTGSITGATTGAVLNSGTLANSGTITGGTLGVQISGGTLANSGTVTATNGVGVSLYYGTLNNLAGGVITSIGDAIENTYGGVTVTNAGTINGNVNFALAPSYYYLQSNVFVDQGGTINGNLVFGSGADTYVTDASKYVNGKFTNVSGTVDGGGGQDTLVLRVGSDNSTKAASATNFERVEYDLSNGAKLTLGADTPVNTTLVLAGTGAVDLTADMNVTNNLALVVGTAYGASYNDPAALSIVSHGNLSFSQTTPYAYSGISLAGTTSFENDGTITATSQYIMSPSVAAISGGALVTNSGTITVTNAAAVLNAEKVVNTGSIVQGPNAQTSFGQYTYGLYGVNNVENSGTITTGGTAITLGYVNYYATTVPVPSVTNSGLIHSTGGDAIYQYYSYPSPSGPIVITNTAGGRIISDNGYAINGGGYSTNIYNDGTITGNIRLYYGTNLVENHGTITGNIDLGYGNTSILLLTGGIFTGAATTEGNSRLVLDVTDANAPTLALGTSSFIGFQELDMQAGTASIGGTYSFNTVNVSGGRLIGLVGSSLSAANINVAAGATFGSAGTVSGNVAVNGTLSPGASPGTMTVIGDVSLAKGSTSLFELTPTVNDKLLVSGKLTIAQGATLQFTGTPKVVPGQKLDLIETGQGINGTFSTISGVPANLHLIQTADSLQGLGLFTTNTAFSSQVSNVVNTLNAALIDGTAGASLIAAMPALVDANDNSDPNALLRLTPQAYASASQLATEDALTVIDALRDGTHFTDGAPKGFAFGQVLDSGRKLAGNTDTGVANAKLTDSGALAGLGYGAKTAWIAGFVGHLNGRERISDLDARTTTRSLVLGAQGQVRMGGFQLGLMSAYDRGDANTKRTVPGGIDADGRYTLKSWIADLDMSYRAKLNADWAVVPRLAASYVRTTRDGLTEQGGGVFALTVDGDRSTRSFVDGAVEFDGGQAAGATLHPFASVGFISRTGGRADEASASLNGLPVPLTATGLDLRGTRATIGTGLRYDLSAGLKASAGYDGEFGHDGRQQLTIGLNWAF